MNPTQVPASRTSHTVPVRSFQVTPTLPPPLQPLGVLATNLWSTWQPDARALFRTVDAALERECHGNPIQVLGRVSLERLQELAADAGFVAEVERVAGRLHDVLAAPIRDGATRRLGYFSAEYGLHECIPLYSGGLGVLAGDTLKSFSDLRIPAVAAGLAYRHGYFRQHLDRDGWQTESYEDLDFTQRPMSLCRNEDGSPLCVEVEVGKRTVRAQIWRVQVGRVTLALLDSNLPDAPAVDRRITANLYGGDHRMRIEQELLLGVGGYRALCALGLEPDVCHMNEGHSALLALEQMARAMDRHGLSFDEARVSAASRNLFTTHTPVPAGHDEFAPELMHEYLEPIAARLGATVDSLMDMARSEPGNPSGPFSMTVLGLRMSRHRNGVSELHGKVSRDLWKGLWPELPRQDVPIGAVTNGVHGGTWIADEISELLTRHLGSDWTARPHDAGLYANLEHLDDGELWSTRTRLRQRLVEDLRRRLGRQAQARGTAAQHGHELAQALDPDALTIGFCRRFATYKRATLPFRDAARLRELVLDAGRPVRLVFAGKAHPKDEPGKRFLAEVVRHSWEPDLLGKIVFVEDYDIELARVLVQGVDVWLNTPQRPYEASGTSGMKAGMNGALNLSILDGWWCEGFHGDNGWAIGDATEMADADLQDDFDATSLYETLENQVRPAFYERDERGVPLRWCRMMKAALRSVGPAFHSNRMVDDYWQHFHRSLLEAADRHADDLDRLRDLVRWRTHVRNQWPSVRITAVECDLDREYERGETMHVTVTVEAPGLEPDQLAVDVVHGPADGDRRLLERHFQAARAVHHQDGHVRFEAELPCDRTGRQGLAARVRPTHDGADWLWDDSLVRWG